MARVICKLLNASDEISGVKFSPHQDGMISEDVADHVATRFASIPGYIMVAVEAQSQAPEPPPAPAPAPEMPAEPPPAEPQAPPAAAPDLVESLRAEATALGISVDMRWKASRLKTEIDAAKAERDAAPGDTDEF